MAGFFQRSLSAPAKDSQFVPAGQLEVILDRRLMQDDNRGLGQGLKDNKRTRNHFRLLLERRTLGSEVGWGPPSRGGLRCSKCLGSPGEGTAWFLRQRECLTP